MPSKLELLLCLTSPVKLGNGLKGNGAARGKEMNSSCAFLALMSNNIETCDSQPMLNQINVSPRLSYLLFNVVCNQQVIDHVHEHGAVRVQINAQFFDDIVLGQVIQHEFLFLVVNVNAVHARVPVIGRVSVNLSIMFLL